MILAAIFISIFALIQGVNAVYDESKHNIIVYWGQGSNQDSLGTYCQNGNFDIVLLSFLNNFDATSASVNFGNACWGTTCPQIAKDIVTCQNLGIKVLLSLGGDSTSGTYGYSTAAEGTSGADVIYNSFNPNGDSSVTKPFGDAEIDGFDFDIENGKSEGLADLVTALRAKWTSKKLIISAAPQCPFPDANLNTLLKSTEASVDIAMVQFYNNPACSLSTGKKKFKQSWNTWYKFITEESGNKNMKAYIALATSSNAEYFVSITDVELRTTSARKSSSFGGFGLWDVATGVKKMDGTTDYVTGLANILGNTRNSDTSSSSSNSNSNSDSVQIKVSETISSVSSTTTFTSSTSSSVASSSTLETVVTSFKSATSVYGTATAT